MNCKVCNRVSEYAYGYCYAHWLHYYRTYIKPTLIKCRFCSRLYRRRVESAVHGRGICFALRKPVALSRLPYVPELEA